MANVGYASLSIIPVAKGFKGQLANAVGPGAKAAGLSAGKKLGQSLAQGLEQSKAAVSKASESLAKARGKEEDASNKVRVAELKLQELRESGRAKASSIEAAEGRLTKAKRDSADAATATKKAEDELSRSNEQLAKATDASATKFSTLRGRAADASGTVGKLGTVMAGASGPIGAAGETVKLTAERLEGLADSSEGALLSRDNIKAFAAGAVAAAATATAALYNIGAGFDDMTTAITVGTGATGEQLAGLEDVAASVGTEIPTSFDAAGKAVADLNTATGATGDELKHLSEQVLNVSRLTGSDASASAEKYGQILTKWGIDAEDGADKLDGLFSIVQDTGIGFDELQSQLTRNSSAFQNAGFSIDETAQLMGNLHASGARVNKIVPNLNRQFIKWAESGTDVREALGDDVDAIRNASSAQEAMAAISEDFTGGAAQELVSAVRNGAFSLDDLGGSLNDAAGTIADTDERTRTFTESWQLLKNKGLEAIRGPATAVFDTLTTGITTFTDWITGIDGATDALKVVGKIIAPMAGTILAIVGAVKALSIATAAWEAIMSASTITLVVTALAGLAAGLVVAYQKSETFRNIVQAAWDGIKTVVSAAWNGVIKPVWDALAGFITGTLMPVITSLWQGVIKPAFEGIGDIISWAWDNVIEPIFTAYKAYISKVLIPVIKMLWQKVVKPAFEGIGDIISAAWNGVIKPVFGFFGDAIGVLGDTATWLWDNAIKPAWDGITSAIDTAWNSVLKPTFGWIGDAFSALGDTFGTVGDTITGIWDGIVHAVAVAVKAIGQILQKVKIPDWVPGIGGKGLGGLGDTLVGWADAHMATGGLLRGPGTGTSDDMLIAASNGEFVTNAKATAANRPLLEAINNGWTPPPELLHAMLPGFARGGYVQAIVQSAADHGMGRDAAIIGTATGLAESGLRVLANPAVPESYNFPHDGEGYDHDSVGIFQQRQAGWGTIADRMDPKRSADMFFDALAGVPGWQNMDPAMAAQAVQRSGISDGSNYRAQLAEAEQLVDGAGDLPDTGVLADLDGPVADTVGAQTYMGAFSDHASDTGTADTGTAGAEATTADGSDAAKVFVTNWPSSLGQSLTGNTPRHTSGVTTGTATSTPSTATATTTAAAATPSSDSNPLAGPLDIAAQIGADALAEIGNDLGSNIGLDSLFDSPQVVDDTGHLTDSPSTTNAPITVNAKFVIDGAKDARDTADEVLDALSDRLSVVMGRSGR